MDGAGKARPPRTAASSALPAAGAHILFLGPNGIIEEGGRRGASQFESFT
jgi:hypothetical protein